MNLTLNYDYTIDATIDALREGASKKRAFIVKDLQARLYLGDYHHTVRTALMPPPLGYTQSLILAATAIPSRPLHIPDIIASYDKIPGAQKLNTSSFYTATTTLEANGDILALPNHKRDAKHPRAQFIELTVAGATKLQSARENTIFHFPNCRSLRSEQCQT